MTILKNAIDSIQIGVDDFEDPDERRSASAVRNIFAGLLLLYKEKLCRLSPAHDKELLIRQNILPVQDADENILFKGKGNKTVDVSTIEERFKSLNVNVDWARFREINSLRNDLEHYYTAKSPDAVREVISKSFLLIRDFLVSELNEDPVELIGSDCWSTLLAMSDVYAAEQKDCNTSILKIDWKYRTVKESLRHLRCPECSSALVQAPYEDDLLTPTAE
ncbi:hypothetical protein [Rhodoferax sp. OV413]|uniref:hypothetical protein n=1 Tax=Rhodoferax sp. OV413 TaxID=1855285 RepID=UPI00115FAD30|nr:hypothetical protein [Rhodoferax sp. OV413]